jgi:MYXO-CTERM domain-containing protein
VAVAGSLVSVVVVAVIVVVGLFLRRRRRRIQAELRRLTISTF